MTKQYNSFEEINERLKILGLQREIARENLKLKLNRAKTNLYPSKLSGSLNGALKQMALTIAIQKLAKLFRKRLQH